MYVVEENRSLNSNPFAIQMLYTLKSHTTTVFSIKIRICFLRKSCIIETKRTFEVKKRKSKAL